PEEARRQGRDQDAQPARASGPAQGSEPGAALGAAAPVAERAAARLPDAGPDRRRRGAAAGEEGLLLEAVRQQLIPRRQRRTGDHDFGSVVAPVGGPVYIGGSRRPG